MSADRIAALKALIAYELPLEPALATLASCGWDIDGPLVTLTHNDVARILQRKVAGLLTAEQFTDSADLIECREDIHLPIGPPDVSAAIFRLANPGLQRPITEALVAEMSAAFEKPGSAV
jgi:hypothetical protein